MQLWRWLGICWVLTAPTVGAESFLGITSGMMFIDNNGETFKPVIGGISTGYFNDTGVGVELALATGITSDEQSGVETELDLHVGGYLHYRQLFNNRAYLTLGVGYTVTELDSQVNNSGFPASQSYRGAAFKAGLEERLKSNPNILLKLTYQHSYPEGDTSISSAQFGVLYAF